MQISLSSVLLYCYLLCSITLIYSFDYQINYQSTIMSRVLFRKVPQAKLGVSEPNPSWFGNNANEASNPSWTNKNWLKSRFHFSFAEYSNPRNTGFGILRVMNDDLVQPNRGFGTHPHRDMEICTYIVEGKLTHKDSMGTQETLERGAVQFMTAGTGVSHSEHNLDKSNPLRFIQIWIQPRRSGLKPNYGSAIGDYQTRENKWAHLVSDVSSSVSTPIKINQDANIHVTEVAPGKSAEFQLQDGRQGYLLCMEGTAVVTGNHGSEILERHDAAEVFGSNTFQVTSQDTSPIHMLFIEMKFTGNGRSDL